MKQTLRSLLALALMVSMLFSSQALAAYETLEYGSRGSDVLKLQQSLLQLGFDPNGVDGKFGRGTEKAVTAYQKARGLEADGARVKGGRRARRPRCRARGRAAPL